MLHLHILKDTATYTVYSDAERDLLSELEHEELVLACLQ
jgi:hypothetical protein